MVKFLWGGQPEEADLEQSQTGQDGAKASKVVVIDTAAVAVEVLAMFMFVVIGCGVACGHGAGDAAQRLVVAFAFGMGILVLAYSIGHHSGGQINCAVTFALVLSGKLPWQQGLANTGGQLVGSLLGAMFLAIMFPCGVDMTGTLGTNVVNLEAYGRGRALLGEVFGTFLLCFCVFETAVSAKSYDTRTNAVIAIGFAVFLSHLILLPIDGCSINPTRSFGPAIIGMIRAGADKTCPKKASEQGMADLWIMWVGPLVGAALAAGVQKPLAFQQAAQPAKPEIPSRE